MPLYRLSLKQCIEHANTVHCVDKEPSSVLEKNETPYYCIATSHKGAGQSTTPGENPERVDRS